MSVMLDKDILFNTLWGTSAAQVLLNELLLQEIGIFTPLTQDWFLQGLPLMQHVCGKVSVNFHSLQLHTHTHTWSHTDMGDWTGRRSWYIVHTFDLYSNPPLSSFAHQSFTPHPFPCVSHSLRLLCSLPRSPSHSGSMTLYTHSLWIFSISCNKHQQGRYQQPK